MWYLIAALFLSSYAYGETSERKRVYAICTPSHEPMLYEFWLTTMLDDYDVHIRHCEQKCRTGCFMKAGWTATTIQKMHVLIDATKENWGDWCIFSDVDIQWFRPTEPILAKYMADGYDIVFQRGDPKQRRVCTGFFAFRANEKTLQLWEDALAYMASHPKTSEQPTVNRLLRIDPPQKKNRGHNKYGIKWAYLPSTFFTGATIHNLKRKPRVPGDIVIHHATRVVGVNGKLRQLTYVRNAVTGEEGPTVGEDDLEEAEIQDEEVRSHADEARRIGLR